MHLPISRHCWSDSKVVDRIWITKVLSLVPFLNSAWICSIFLVSVPSLEFLYSCYNWSIAWFVAGLATNFSQSSLVALARNALEAIALSMNCIRSMRLVVLMIYSIWWRLLGKKLGVFLSRSLDNWRLAKKGTENTRRVDKHHHKGTLHLEPWIIYIVYDPPRISQRFRDVFTRLRKSRLQVTCPDLSMFVSKFSFPDFS